MKKINTILASNSPRRRKILNQIGINFKIISSEVNEHSNLNYSPKIKFKDGLRLMLNNLSSWKNAPLWTKKTIKESTKDWFKYIK